MLKKFFKFGKKKKEQEEKDEEILEEEQEQDQEEAQNEEIGSEEEEHEEKAEEMKADEAKEEEVEVTPEVEEVPEVEPEPEVESVDETEEVEEIQEEEEEEEKKVGLFGKLKKGLTKTREGITGKINNVLKNYRKIDEELFEEIEEILITADIGVNITMRIIEDLEDKVKERKIEDPSKIMDLLKEELEEILTDVETNNKLNIEPSPAIVLVVGVNGVGKTTSIGKMSAKLKRDGKKVIVAAGDTFRAAAIEQLEEWTNRAGVDIISHQEGADPAAVIFDGVQAAKARKADVLICDTAGRLHNKKNLMNELNKIFRVIEREYPDATKEVLLVVDATTGQNAIMQAKVFKEACDITGIVLTKLDGTAKGGVVLAVQSELDVPVKFVGVGEQIDDLQEFDPRDFIEAIFED